jgi:hypothetical protein
LSTEFDGIIHEFLIYHLDERRDKSL